MKEQSPKEIPLIIPDWPAPPSIRACVTTRSGGVSEAPYTSLNLGTHVGDNPQAVLHNRALLQHQLQLSTPPRWLNQTHSTRVISLDNNTEIAPNADASFSQTPNKVSVIMTADCLPILLCDHQGTTVAALHAGWRGLLDGIIEATVSTLPCSPPTLMAWIGPGISAKVYEVGSEMYDGFLRENLRNELAFKAHGTDKWLADLSLLAKMRLERCGITDIYGGQLCTYQDKTQFFSFRRDNITGRMATLIWISPTKNTVIAN